MITYSSGIFFFLLFISIYLFIKNILKFIRNINLGLPYSIPKSTFNKRALITLKVAFGQSKMKTKPISAILHFVIYTGFIIINIEFIEIIIDGIFNTHRFLSEILSNKLYNTITITTEIFAFLVLISATLFFIRRNFLGLKQFNKKEINGWAKLDGNIILIFEIVLMISFLLMNASDFQIMSINNNIVGKYPISNLIFDLKNIGLTKLIFIERFCWWFHIVGILVFLNYLYYSKHSHIISAFPNIFYSKLENLGYLENIPAITYEVRSILGMETSKNKQENIKTFGAKDIFDLNKKQLLNAYTCTECGRCTEVCPVNISGKKLSPRKIMMNTRDRLEEVSKNIDKNKTFINDGKSLIDDYILREEIWSCTLCMACVHTCPLNIDPMSIIIDLRRYIYMEESKMPHQISMINNNIEINYNPWKLSQNDRTKWAK